MVRKINLTLTMEVSDTDNKPLTDKMAREMVEITEDAIRDRLMSEGYLPDENMGIDNYGFSHTLEA